MWDSHRLRLHWEELGTLHSAPSNKTVWGGPSGCSCEWRAHRILWVVRKQGQKTFCLSRPCRAIVASSSE